MEPEGTQSNKAQTPSTPTPAGPSQCVALSGFPYNKRGGKKFKSALQMAGNNMLALVSPLQLEGQRKRETLPCVELLPQEEMERCR